VQALEPPTHFEMVCADTITSVDMAVETGHIAIAGYFATLDHLATGRLVAPFDVAVCPRSQFWFVCERGRETEPAMLLFRDAVKDCAARLKATTGNLKMLTFEGTELSETV
ncbi:unnamed protein product, partial [Ectocarpus sp. 12 AP-2014]